jgi:hypothetical protein
MENLTRRIERKLTQINADCSHKLDETRRPVAFHGGSDCQQLAARSRSREWASLTCGDETIALPDEIIFHKVRNRREAGQA